MSDVKEAWLANEIIDLRRWKAEATVVLSEWDQVWEAAGRPGQLGESKAAAVRRMFEMPNESPAWGTVEQW